MLPGDCESEESAEHRAVCEVSPVLQFKGVVTMKSVQSYSDHPRYPNLRKLGAHQEDDRLPVFGRGGVPRLIPFCCTMFIYFGQLIRGNDLREWLQSLLQLGHKGLRSGVYRVALEYPGGSRKGSGRGSRGNPVETSTLFLTD